MTPLNVHIVDSPWPTILASGAIGLLGAIIGAIAVWWTARSSAKATASDALKAQQDEWDRQRSQLEAERTQQEAQHQRELLARAAGRLLDALWVKERELCDALQVARSASEAGVNVSPGDEALNLLGSLDLAIYSDLICALPLVLDNMLRERLRSAGTVVNGCYNLRCNGTGGSPELFIRAIIEVQQYFKWLRWNLSLGLQGQELPPEIEVLDVRRPQSEPSWPQAAGIPDYT